MILTKAQFEAVRDAMCALNNIGAMLNVKMDVKGVGTYTRVVQYDEGAVRVLKVEYPTIVMVERYATQNDFCDAYDPYLDFPEPF